MRSEKKRAEKIQPTVYEADVITFADLMAQGRTMTYSVGTLINFRICLPLYEIYLLPLCLSIDTTLIILHPFIVYLNFTELKNTMNR